MKKFLITEELLRDLLNCAFRYKALERHNIEEEYAFYYDALDDFAVEYGVGSYENFDKLAEEYMNMYKSQDTSMLNNIEHCGRKL